MSDIRLAQYGGYIFVVRTAMTPTQVKIVRESFDALRQQADEASRIFYDELFKLAPELKQIFPDDMAKHRQKFVQMLGTVVGSLDHVARVSDHVIELGRRHMAYDVEDEHYAVVGNALQTMLKRMLGLNLTPEVSDAWSAAYNMLARVMQESANIPNTPEGFYGTIIRSVLTSHYGISIAASEPSQGRASITNGIERGRVLNFS